MLVTLWMSDCVTFQRTVFTTVAHITAFKPVNGVSDLTKQHNY